ncbi:UNVERIFIED_CONTAM: hypothetical protein FKN15_043511 [Acipenser sinensis]
MPQRKCKRTVKNVAEKATSATLDASCSAPASLEEAASPLPQACPPPSSTVPMTPYDMDTFAEVEKNKK